MPQSVFCFCLCVHRASLSSQFPTRHCRSWHSLCASDSLQLTNDCNSGIYLIDLFCPYRWLVADRESTVRFSAGLGLGLLCSAFYWVMVAAELPWMRPDTEHPFSAINFVFFDTSPNRPGLWCLVCESDLLDNPCDTDPAGGSPTEGVQRQTQTNPLDGRRSNRALILHVHIFKLHPVARPAKAKRGTTSLRWLAVSSIGAPRTSRNQHPDLATDSAGKGRPLAHLAIGCVLLSPAFSDLASYSRDTLFVAIRNTDAIRKPRRHSHDRTMVSTVGKGGSCRNAGRALCGGKGSHPCKVVARAPYLLFWRRSRCRGASSNLLLSIMGRIGLGKTTTHTSCI